MAVEDPIAAKLESDLSESIYACSALTKLWGGSANFTYRGILCTPLTDDTTSIIIKHAEPYIAANKSWPFDPIRSYYEQMMLGALSSLPASNYKNVHVTTPKLYTYEEKTATLLISDYPCSLELKEYLTVYGATAPPSQVLRLGISLGNWLKSFHMWASAPQQEMLREQMKKNSQMQNLKYLLNYGRLEASIDFYPDILEGSRTTFRDIATHFKEELNADEGTLIHGDFWSGNILLKDATLPLETERSDLLIIDFELAHLGSQAFDIGQCFAELYMLTHFRNVAAGVQLIAAFMEGYGSIDRDLACRAALHFGVHLVVWSHRITPAWGEGETMESCVRFGLDCITHAWARDVEWFKGGVLGNIFSSIRPSLAHP
ncbi:MAG: hypothetical protein M1818_002588 [Claussenomyces sp. TS43310]|nr:MAG: hypothetical protein M1818_002588 [Claussenomyces sp. TS43310]